MLDMKTLHSNQIIYQQQLLGTPPQDNWMLTTCKQYSCREDGCFMNVSCCLRERLQGAHRSQTGKLNKCDVVNITSCLDLGWTIKYCEREGLLCIRSHEVCQIYAALQKKQKGMLSGGTRPRLAQAFLGPHSATCVQLLSLCEVRCEALVI